MDKLKSRKLWVAVLTIVALLVGRKFDVDVTADAVVAIVSVVYLLAQGWVDARANGGISEVEHLRRLAVAVKGSADQPNRAELQGYSLKQADLPITQ